MSVRYRFATSVFHTRRQVSGASSNAMMKCCRRSKRASPPRLLISHRPPRNQHRLRSSHSPHPTIAWSRRHLQTIVANRLPAVRLRWLALRLSPGRCSARESAIKSRNKRPWLRRMQRPRLMHHLRSLLLNRLQFLLCRLPAQLLCLLQRPALIRLKVLPSLRLSPLRLSLRCRHLQHRRPRQLRPQRLNRRPTPLQSPATAERPAPATRRHG